MYTLDCPCLPLGDLNSNGSVGSNPLWKAIQSEAQFHHDNEPLLAESLGTLVIEPANLVESLGRIAGRRLFGAASDSFVSLLTDAANADHRLEGAIIADLQFIRRQDPATVSFLNPFLHFKGFHAVVVHRVAHWLWHNDRILLAQHLQSRAAEVFGVDIHPAASVGRGIFIDHATGVVIGETAVIGDEVAILHGVTLGGTGKTTGDRHPKIGNGVLIGANAQLLGNIIVGDRAKIGAGSVVVHSVPAGETVIGVAARSTRMNYRDKLTG